MSVTEFGRALLDTLDLDPDYVVAYRAKMPRGTLKRWLLAYWCFSHAGVASRIAAADDFHREMWRAQEEQWPRGQARRHFRGQKSADALRWLADHFPEPEKAIDELCEATTFAGVRERILRWPQMGSWAAFKSADMLERVLGHPVAFSLDDLNFYEGPAAGAKLVDAAAPLRQVVEKLIDEFRGRLAPPANDRPVGIQEVETILCKYKSYVSGHYRIGQDREELREALRGWGPLADRLASHLPGTHDEGNRDPV
jgi:hypothetical protein